MARFTGGIPFIGKMAGLTFYRYREKWVARRAGGMSREQMMNDPAMFRIRNHHSEFRSWSKGRSSLKSALNRHLQLGDGTLHNRLLRLCSRITNRGDGEKGTRPLAFSRYKNALTGFQVNGERTLNSFVLANIMIKPADDGVGAVTKISETTLHPREDGEFFRLSQLVGIVSDVVFDENQKEYVFAAPDVNAMAEVSHSDYFPLGMKAPEIVLETRLPLAEVPDTATVFVAIGIQFFDDSDGKFLPRHAQRAMTILGAW